MLHRMVDMDRIEMVNSNRYEHFHNDFVERKKNEMNLLLVTADRVTEVVVVVASLKHLHNRSKPYYYQFVYPINDSMYLLEHKPDAIE